MIVCCCYYYVCNCYTRLCPQHTFNKNTFHHSFFLLWFHFQSFIWEIWSPYEVCFYSPSYRPITHSQTAISFIWFSALFFFTINCCFVFIFFVVLGEFNISLPCCWTQHIIITTTTTKTKTTITPTTKRQQKATVKFFISIVVVLCCSFSYSLFTKKKIKNKVPFV